MPENFFKTWESIIDSTKNSNGIPITQGTKRSKTQTLNLLREFSKSEKFELSFENIDMNFYHQFDQYMCRLGLSGNSRGKHFKEIKAIMREADDRGIKINNSFQKKSFRVIRAKPDNVYLNENEIKKIFLLNLSPAQAKLRDIFVMAAYSGLRHSDWDQLRTENIVTERSMQMLRIQQKKTKDVVYIPIHSAVRQILEKYKENPPKVAICKKADLGLVTIDGKSFEKWKLVSTHTARRSFATNAYLSKSMDVYQIMNCTGHKSESSFLRYLKLDGRDFAIQAAESKFFKDDTWTSMKIAS
jgi:integrase